MKSNWNQALEEALIQARDSYCTARPLSAEAFQEAEKVMPGGNTRTVLYHDPYPFQVKSGDGAYIMDADGNRLLNCLGEYTAGLFGHNHPVIRQAVSDALDKGVNLGAHNSLEPAFAKLVCDRFPAVEKVRFTNSGTEANLMAITAARAHTGRSHILVFEGGYHGGVFLCKPEITTNAPYTWLMAPYNDLDITRDLIRNHADDLAAVVIEPMLGSGGCLPADPEFLQMLRDETRACGSLLIFDEVMTSRLGPNGAQGLYDITPDLCTFGKWLGGGMTVGAFGGLAEIMNRFDPRRPDAISHAGTFNNNVLTMAAGIAALGEIYTKQRGADFLEEGDRLREKINDKAQSLGLAFQATGRGSLMALQPALGDFRTYQDLAGIDDRLRELLFLDLLEEGIYIARRGFVALSLALGPAEQDHFTDRLFAVQERRTEFFQAG